jgi:neutral ceramidase
MSPVTRHSDLSVRLFALLCVLVSCAFGAVPAGIRAGAAIEDITPKNLPSPINGNMKGAFVNTVTDPMHARAFAVHDGRTELIFCVVDACMIPREICDAAKTIASKQTGVPTAQLLISATHSHTCATMTGVFQSEPDPAYVAEAPARIAQALIRAHANLEPAEIAFGKDQDPTQVFNRRWFVQQGQSYENPFDSMGDRVWMNPGYRNAKVTEPSGPVDPDVTLLAARAKSDGRPIAVLANYSLHYVGGVPAISADYFGAFARELATRLKATDTRYAGKPAFVGIMSNGTSGNINNVNYAGAPVPRRAPGEQIAAVAKSVTDAAMRAWEKLSWQSTASIATRERDIALGVRKATPAELERARQVLASTPPDKDGQFSDRKAIYAREATLLDAYPDKVSLKLQAHRIGSLTIAAIPCEVFVEIGLDLKLHKPLQEHFTISLANGYNGYLPTPEHHRFGGYETWRARSSYLETDASTRIVETLREMLAEVAK